MSNKANNNTKQTRQHDHFTMGKQGHDPKTARLMNQKKKKQEKKKK
jgi:hypothetical protein